MSTLRFTVTDDDTAIALGSGDVPVLATPRLLAWMEAASVAAAATMLDPGFTTVGIDASVRHRRATVVGGTVEVSVTSVEPGDRRVTFDVVARELGSGTARREIGSGRITRAVVDRQGFLESL